MIRAEILWHTLAPNRMQEHPAQSYSIYNSGMDAESNNSTRELVHHDQDPMCSQGCRLTTKQIAAPQAVFGMAKEGEPGWTLRMGVRPVMQTQDATNYILVDLDAKGQCDLSGNAGQPQFGFRRFISTMAAISSFSGPLGPGRRRRFGENSMRYFHLHRRR